MIDEGWFSHYGNLDFDRARFPHSHSHASPRMEKWKTTSRFSTFPRGPRDDSYRFIFSGNQKPNTQIGRFAASLILSQDHLALEMLAIPKNTLPRRAPTRYNKLSPGRGSLAGFEVTLYGRF